MSELSVIKIQDFEKDGAYCTLLKYKKVKILLDCGLNENFDLNNYKKYSDLLNDIDLILISSCELKNCGGLVYLARKYNYFSNIYCTLPVKYMINSNLIIKLLYLNDNSSKVNKINFFQNTEIIINRIQDLKFQQEISKKVNESKIRFVAIPKGGSFGSCAYKIQIDEKKYMYLIEYSIHQSEVSIPLDTNYFFSQKIDYLITQVTQQQSTYTNPKKLFTKALESLLDQTQNIKNLIFMFDQTGRIFEYIFILNKIMVQKNINIQILLPNTYEYCLDVIKRLTEFMSCNISQNFTFQDDNYFNFRTLSLIDSSKLDQNQQHIIIGSYQDFQKGQFTHILNQCNDENNHIYYLENQDNKSHEKINQNFFEEITNLNDDGFQDDHKIHDSQIEDDLTTLETFNDIINRKIDTNFEIEEDEIQEETEEEKLMNWDYFVQKSDYISFKTQDLEIEQTEYGLTLDQEEKQNFNVNNFENVVIQKNENCFRNFSIQREEFYKIYTQFLLKEQVQLIDNRQIIHEIVDKNKNDHFINQKIFLNNMNVKENIILLSNLENDLKNQKIITFDHEFTMNIGQNFENLYLDPNFQQIQLNNYDNNLKYQYIKFCLDKNQQKDIQVKLVEQQQKQYQIFTSKYLLKIQEFLEQNGYVFDIKFNHISYNDKILLIKQKDSYLLEGKYSFEYFKIRQLLYQFNIGEIQIAETTQIVFIQNHNILYDKLIFFIFFYNQMIKLNSDQILCAPKIFVQKQSSTTLKISKKKGKIRSLSVCQSKSNNILIKEYVVSNYLGKNIIQKLQFSDRILQQYITQELSKFCQYFVKKFKNLLTNFDFNGKDNFNVENKIYLIENYKLYRKINILLEHYRDISWQKTNMLLKKSMMQNNIIKFLITYSLCKTCSRKVMNFFYSVHIDLCFEIQNAKNCNIDINKKLVKILQELINYLKIKKIPEKNISFNSDKKMVIKSMTNTQTPKTVRIRDNKEKNNNKSKFYVYKNQDSNQEFCKSRFENLQNCQKQLYTPQDQIQDEDESIEKSSELEQSDKQSDETFDKIKICSNQNNTQPKTDQSDFVDYYKLNSNNSKTPKNVQNSFTSIVQNYQQTRKKNSIFKCLDYKNSIDPQNCSNSQKFQKQISISKDSQLQKNEWFLNKFPTEKTLQNIKQKQNLPNSEHFSADFQVNDSFTSFSKPHLQQSNQILGSPNFNNILIKRIQNSKSCKTQNFFTPIQPKRKKSIMHLQNLIIDSATKDTSNKGSNLQNEVLKVKAQKYLLQQKEYFLKNQFSYSTNQEKEIQSFLKNRRFNEILDIGGQNLVEQLIGILQKRISSLKEYSVLLQKMKKIKKYQKNNYERKRIDFRSQSLFITKTNLTQNNIDSSTKRVSIDHSNVTTHKTRTTNQKNCDDSQKLQSQQNIEESSIELKPTSNHKMNHNSQRSCVDNKTSLQELKLEKTCQFDILDEITEQNQKSNALLTNMNIEGLKLINSDGEFQQNKQKEKLFKIQQNNLQIQNYEFLKQLGEGAYGKVYLVHKKDEDDEYYAMKIIQFQDKIDQKFLKSLKNEIQILSVIEGQYLVKAYCSFVQQSQLCILMEYMVGGDMRQLLDEFGRLDDDDARYFIAQVIVAVKDLHKQNIIHRDLKPGNLLLNKKGQIKIADFGLSYLHETIQKNPKQRYTIQPKNIIQTLDKASNNNLLNFERKTVHIKNCKRQKQIKKTSNFVGTADYIALEIINNTSKEKYRKAVDWWSVGCILYEFLIGVPAFGGKSVEEVFENIKKQKIIWPQIGYEEDQINPSAKNLIESFLETDPKKRLQNIQNIEKHEFFDKIDWKNLNKIQSPFSFFVHEKKKINIDKNLMNKNKIQQSIQSTNLDQYSEQLYMNRNDLLNKENYKKLKQIQAQWQKMIESLDHIQKKVIEFSGSQINFKNTIILKKSKNIILYLYSIFQLFIALIFYQEFNLPDYLLIFTKLRLHLLVQVFY